MTRLTLIVAATRSNGIGQNGQLPWRLSREMAYFKRVTTTAPDGLINAVLMGRNTWESIPPKFRPLAKRLNIVISSNEQYQLMPTDASKPCESIHLHSNLASAIERISNPQLLESPIHRAFIIGGASLYRDTLALPPTSNSFVDRVLLTRILSPAFQDCDALMPDFLAEGSEGNGHTWRRASHDELQEWAEFEVAAGTQEENGVQYEFQMWVR